MAKNPNQKQISKFILKLLALRDEACRLDMFATMHDLNKLINKAGWELADRKPITDSTEETRG